jgi:hypothetical protein
MDKHFIRRSCNIANALTCNSYLLFDRTGSYDIVWSIIIGLGVLAMAINLPIDQRPLARLREQPA